MILTFAWKEIREHRAIWITMAILTVVLGIGLGRLISANDPRAAIGSAAVTILGLAAVYGVVCGAMMLAGEQETGTLVFLDVFLGSRAKLWLIKFFLGAVFVLTQALTVAAGLVYLEQAIPDWGLSILGISSRQLIAGPNAAASRHFLWFFILPAITLEAYAWGLLGSALSRRVLSGAAIAALAAAPVWLISVFTPPPVFLGVRIVVALLVLGVSLIQFILSLGQTPLGASMPLERSPNRRREFLDRFDRLARDDWERAADYEPIPAAILVAEDAPHVEAGRPVGVAPPPLPPLRRRQTHEDAGSPFAALLWLSFQQAWAFVLILLGVCVVVGMSLPFNGQVVWPFATLLIGVACGTATFGPEQRDLSYQFLSAQHFPLQSIWRFKVAFWFGAALLAVGFLVLGGGIALSFQALTQARRFGPQFDGPHFRFGTLRHILGPVLFFSVWAVYGFVAGHLFVWLCRKTLLALALSISAALVALGLWLPSLLCGGMAGWQVWLPPLAGLVAASLLVRAWAGGRIKDRRPLALLFACAAVIVLWVAVTIGIRVWTLPHVGAPLDRVAFRASIPTAAANAGGQKIQEALADFRAAPLAESAWLQRLDEANRLPLGIIESPPGDGQTPLLRHLPDAESMARRLRDRAAAKQRDGDHAAAFEHLSQILLLSRSMRAKAPLESYLVGIKMEEVAFDGLNHWFTNAKPNAPLLRKVLDVLKRHAAETPPPLECLQTECFRAGGILANPSAWNFAGGPGRLPEPWLINGISLSLDFPWEAERSTRIWQLVWAGLFRTLETPYSELSTSFEPPPGSPVTRTILRGWLAPKAGPAAAWSDADVAALLDASWLADERLFTLALPLRFESTRSRWRTDAALLKTALALYRLEEGKNAPDLAALTPKYLPTLPVDPYTNAPFGYRISAGENIPQVGPVLPGQPILWCAGPDHVNDGGRIHGDRWTDDNPQWFRGGLDLVAVVPMWK